MNGILTKILLLDLHFFGLNCFFNECIPLEWHVYSEQLLRIASKHVYYQV